MAALCQAVETKDLCTRGHSERVSRGAVMIGREIGMRASRVEAVLYAGMLHDVGKFGVPTTVLRKDGPLTGEKFAAIRLHPMRGLQIVQEIGFLDEALAGIMRPWLGSCSTGLAPDFPDSCSGVFQLPSGDIIAQFVTAPGPGAKPHCADRRHGTYRNIGGDGTLVEFGNGRGRLTLHILSLVARG